MAAVLAAVTVSVSFFSSFFTHPRGVIDSVATFTTYVGRASATSGHTHAWHYYFDLLLYFRDGSGPVWTEGLIVGLALVGVFARLTGTRSPGVDRRCRWVGWCSRPGRGGR